MSVYEKCAQVASENRPFTLICSFEVPTTELDSDLIPSINVVVGEYETQEQVKNARQNINSPALISA